MEQAAEMGCSVVLVGEYVQPEPDLTGTITSFSTDTPVVVAHMDTEDQGMLTEGSSITLEALTGEEATMEYITGKSVKVLLVAPLVQLELDLTGYSVVGLTADYTRDLPPEAEAEAAPVKAHKKSREEKKAEKKEAADSETTQHHGKGPRVWE
jgi:hypothetical protein